MGHKLVAHFRKVKTGAGLSAVVTHNSRLGVYNSEGAILDGTEVPDYIKHPEAGRHNWNKGVTAEHVHDLRRGAIEEAKLKRRPQKNAAYAIEATFSASPEWFKGKEIGQMDHLFGAYLGWAEGRFGKENVLHAAVHYDETTPHMHLLLTPIVQTKDGLKYSSSEFLGGRNGLRAIQSDLADFLKRFGLERGVEGSTARHTDQKEWLAEQRRELEKQRKDLEKRAGELDAREEGIAKTETKLADREADIEARANVVAKKETNLTRRETALEVEKKAFQSMGNTAFKDRAEAIESQQQAQANLAKVEKLMQSVKDPLTLKAIRGLPYAVGLVPQESISAFIKDVVKLAAEYQNANQSTRNRGHDKEKDTGR